MKTLILIFILSLGLSSCGGSKVVESKEENIAKSTEQTQQEKQSIFDAVDEQKQTTSNNIAVGTWEMTTETPRGSRNSTLVISEADGKLTGKSDNGTFKITQKGNTLTWNSSMDTPMGSMTLGHEVEINGNEMTGNAKMSSGPMAGRSMSITGTRK